MIVLLFCGWCLHSVVVPVAAQKLLNFIQLRLSRLRIIHSRCSICKTLLIFYLAFLALLYMEVWFGSNESPLLHLLVNKSCWGQFRPLQPAMENKRDFFLKKKKSLECLLSNLNYRELFVLLCDSMTPWDDKRCSICLCLCPRVFLTDIPSTPQREYKVK